MDGGVAGSLWEDPIQLEGDGLASAGQLLMVGLWVNDGVLSQFVQGTQ